jgi:competence protein ComEC
MKRPGYFALLVSVLLSLLLSCARATPIPARTPMVGPTPATTQAPTPKPTVPPTAGPTLTPSLTPTPTPTPTPSPTPAPVPTLTSTPTAAPTSASTPAPQLTVHFIDVGQGDAILVDLGETEVLIDGGEKSPGVVDYLRNYVDGKLEVMVATHPHADHIGGLIAVLDAFEVEQIWDNGDTSDSATYADFVVAVEKEGAQVHVGRRGDKIVAGALTFLILNPTTLAGTTNNNSLVLSLTYGKTDFLFMGDAEKEAEGAMLVASDLPVPDVEILKVGHHGSRTASSTDFLAVTTPEVAIYMAGVGNSYGHPHAETISALQGIGARVYGTDVNGTILVATDGVTYEVRTER